MSRKKYTMTDEAFWTTVEFIGWGTKTTDYEAVEPLLRERGLVWCREFYAVCRNMRENLDAAARRAGYDICMDAWDDTLHHTIGLGQREYEACLRDPKRLVNRYHKRDYVESFTYCIP